MKGLPFTSKKMDRIESFEAVFMRLAQHDQQVLTELLSDYYEDEHCWAWRDIENNINCAWCNASGEDAEHLRHMANCPLAWLQAQQVFLDEQRFKLPRLRIGRSRKTTRIIPEEKLLPGSVEDYTDGRRTAVDPRGASDRYTRPLR